MKNKITLKEFFESKDKLAIHCDTEEKANKLLREFDKLGEKCVTRTSYSQFNKYEVYKDRTYYLNNGLYCSTKYCEYKNIKTYSFEDIIFEENKPKNLIPEIAKMLGVEVGERFKIKGWSSYPYKFDGVLLSRTNGNEWEHATADDYIHILAGKCTIQKLPKVPQLTDAERVILENLPKEYKWIVRDKYNELRMFNTKPFKVDFAMFWGCAVGASLSLEALGHLFQFIKWEDEEPHNIEELLKGVE